MTWRKDTRQAPKPEDLRPVLPWILDASQEVNDHLRAFAARYPNRFEFKDGKLQQRKGR